MLYVGEPVEVRIQDAEELLHVCLLPSRMVVDRVPMGREEEAIRVLDSTLQLEAAEALRILKELSVWPIAARKPSGSVVSK